MNFLSARFAPVASALRALFVLSLAVAGASAASDQEIIANFKAENARLAAELAQTDDVARVHAVQSQIKALLERTVEQVSEKTKPYLRVSLQVIDPLMEESMRYTGLVQKHTEAGTFDFASAGSKESIDARLKLLDELTTANGALARRIAGLEEEIKGTLKASKLSALDQARFLEGFRESSGRRFGALRAIRTLDTSLYVEMREIYVLLREQMGRWSVKDGQIVLEDTAALETFNRRVATIEELAARQQKAINAAAGIGNAPAS